MKKTDLEYFKRLLEEQLEELRSQADQTVNGIRKEGHHYTDLIDQAAFDAGQSMMFRIRSRETNLIRKIKDALARIEDETFGYCEDCGEDIGIKRLMARPVATKCISCKSKEEQFERAAGV